jgi:hypothetical protein
VSVEPFISITQPSSDPNLLALSIFIFSYKAFYSFSAAVFAFLSAEVGFP